MSQALTSTSNSGSYFLSALDRKLPDLDSCVSVAATATSDFHAQTTKFWIQKNQSTDLQAFHCSALAACDSLTRICWGRCSANKVIFASQPWQAKANYPMREDTREIQLPLLQPVSRRGACHKGAGERRNIESKLCGWEGRNIASPCEKSIYAHSLQAESDQS